MDVPIAIFSRLEASAFGSYFRLTSCSTLSLTFFMGSFGHL
jgi:hypothetical protein